MKWLNTFNNGVFDLNIKLAILKIKLTFLSIFTHGIRMSDIQGSKIYE